MTRPCAFCGDPTERVYSFDMDMAGVPLCSCGTRKCGLATSREAMATLSPALISGVEGRVVFAPWEIAA